MSDMDTITVSALHTLALLCRGKLSMLSCVSNVGWRLRVDPDFHSTDLPHDPGNSDILLGSGEAEFRSFNDLAQLHGPRSRDDPGQSALILPGYSPSELIDFHCGSGSFLDSRWCSPIREVFSLETSSMEASRISINQTHLETTERDL
jgi:hypothetical protein